MEPCYPGMAEHLPAQSKWWIDTLFCSACMCSSCFTSLAVFISAHKISHSSDSLWHPTWREWESFWLGLTHDPLGGFWCSALVHARVTLGSGAQERASAGQELRAPKAAQLPVTGWWNCTDHGQHLCAQEFTWQSDLTEHSCSFLKDRAGKSGSAHKAWQRVLASRVSQALRQQEGAALSSATWWVHAGLHLAVGICAGLNHTFWQCLCKLPWEEWDRQLIRGPELGIMAVLTLPFLVANDICYLLAGLWCQWGIALLVNCFHVTMPATLGAACGICALKQNVQILQFSCFLLL